MINKNNSLTELIAAAENNSTTQVVSGSNSKYSFGIVNSQNNGKRLSFSKALAKDTDLTDIVYILPSVASGEVFVAGTSISEKCSKASLSGADKKLCYSTPLVKLIIDTFGLDFGGHTSVSFSDISIEELNGVKVARIRVGQDTSVTQTQSEVDE